MKRQQTRQILVPDFQDRLFWFIVIPGQIIVPVAFVMALTGFTSRNSP